MPTYTFRNKVTGEEYTDLISISTMEQTLKDNPDLDVVPASPLIVSGVGLVIKKASDGWNDRLLEIKKRHPGSDIHTK